MKLRTVVRDCLFLNWALPKADLPKPPGGLRYQSHDWHGAEHVFASALLFHQDAVRWNAFPFLRLSHPQLNVRLYVLDAEGVPAVLFLRELMPRWMASGVRLLARQPAVGARLDFPRPSRQADAGSWRWRADLGGPLSVHAWVHAPQLGDGPRLGTWPETVRYFQDRPRGYAQRDGTLLRVDASHPSTDAVWPLAVDIEEGGALLAPSLAGGNGLHSSWLCPEMPFSFAFDLLPKVHHVVNGLPHPAAGRVSTPTLWVPRTTPAAGAAAPGGGAPRVLASAA